MPTWPITCGSCGRDISAEVVSGWAAGYHQSLQRAESAKVTLWLKCPNEDCGEGSVKLANGAIYPPAPFGPRIEGLPEDVASAWSRMLLMHVAVDKAGSKPGESFVQYIDELEGRGSSSRDFGLLSIR